MIVPFVLAVRSFSTIQKAILTNETPETRRLGRQRIAFFDAIFKVSARHRGIDYSGYRSMLMDDHTTMLWPVGRADEVVYVYGNSGGVLLTQWKLVRQTPKRLFQISYTGGEREFPYDGTVAKFLGKVKATVPKRDAKPLKALLTDRGDYATYIESAAEGVYYCRVLRRDGSIWPAATFDPERTPYQRSDHVKADGLAITPEEWRLIADATRKSPPTSASPDSTTPVFGLGL